MNEEGSAKLCTVPLSSAIGKAKFFYPECSVTFKAGYKCDKSISERQKQAIFFALEVCCSKVVNHENFARAVAVQANKIMQAVGEPEIEFSDPDNIQKCECEIPGSCDICEIIPF